MSNLKIQGLSIYLAQKLVEVPIFTYVLFAVKLGKLGVPL